MLYSSNGLREVKSDMGIGLPITEEPSHTTGRTDRVSGDSRSSGTLVYKLTGCLNYGWGSVSHLD